MRTILAMVVCSLLAIGAARAADCQLKTLGSVDLRVSSDELQIPVSLGSSKKQFVFGLDYPFNLVAQETAEEVGFKIRSLDPNLTVVAFDTKLNRLGYSPKFKIGTIPGDDVEFLIMPGKVPDTDASGILASGMFEKLDFELDIGGSKLNEFSPDHCPGNVVYWTKTGFAELPFRVKDHVFLTDMVLDGQSIPTTITTVNSSIVGMNVIRRLFKLDENSPGMVPARTVTAGVKYYRYPFKSLTVDTLTIRNPDILIYGEPLEYECGDATRKMQGLSATDYVFSNTKLSNCMGPNIQIGLSVLKKLHLYFSSREKIIYATGADAN
jgi:hypothetical protein